MPGMENFAPDRTETSSGSSGVAEPRPIAFSSARRCSAISSSSPSGSVPSAAR